MTFSESFARVKSIVGTIMILIGVFVGLFLRDLLSDIEIPALVKVLAICAWAILAIFLCLFDTVSYNMSLKSYLVRNNLGENLVNPRKCTQK